ncbi:MAG: ComEC/Rec2 family competence protein, partial [Bifidobacteriaceae bacterium]|nr:ComEC/Rec2 family competence protein [Bifidobacteriaceae bacterium]
MNRGDSQSVRAATERLVGGSIKGVDLRLALPALCGWVAVGVAVGFSRYLAVVLAVASGAAGVAAWRRAGSGSLAATAAPTLMVVAALLGSLGIQGLAWDSTELVRLAAESGRANVTMRITEPPKYQADQWGGAGSVMVRGPAWVGAPKGPGVPSVARLPAQPLSQGQLLEFRARLSVNELAEPQRVKLAALGTVAVSQPTGWRAALFQARQNLTIRASPLLTGIALGDTSGLPDRLDQDLKTTSLTHITAVSGAHVAIVLGLVLGLARLAGAPRPVAAAFGAVALLGFAGLIGHGASVWRSVAMGAAAIIGLAAGRTRAALGALAAAVIVVLAANPWLARSYGLILSVLATAALILVAPPLAKWLTRSLPRLPKPVAEGAALTLSAQLACAPVIAMFAGQISLTALPANLLAAPAIPIATVGGLVAALTAPAAPWLADAAAWAGNAGAAWVGQVATWVAAWPVAAIAWPLGLAGLVLAAAASLAAGLAAWRLGRRRRAAQVLIGLLATALAIQALLPRAWIDSALAGRVTADWLFAASDVGQGTAAVLRTGE